MIKKDYYICLGKTDNKFGMTFSQVIEQGLSFMTKLPTNDTVPEYVTEKTSRILKFGDHEDLLDAYMMPYGVDITDMVNDFMANHTVLSKQRGYDQYHVESDVTDDTWVGSFVDEVGSGDGKIYVRLRDEVTDLVQKINPILVVCEECVTSMGEIIKLVEDNKKLFRDVTDDECGEIAMFDKSLTGVGDLNPIEESYIVQKVNENAAEVTSCFQRGDVITDRLRVEFPYAKLSRLLIRDSDEHELDIISVLGGELSTMLFNGTDDDFYEDLYENIWFDENNYVSCDCGINECQKDWFDIEKCECGRYVVVEDEISRMILDNMGVYRNFGSQGKETCLGIYFLTQEEYELFEKIKTNKFRYYIDKFKEITVEGNEFIKPNMEQVGLVTPDLVHDLMYGIMGGYIKWVMDGVVTLRDGDVVHGKLYTVISNEYTRLMYYPTIQDWLENSYTDASGKKTFSDVSMELLGLGVDKLYGDSEADVKSIIKEVGANMREYLNQTTCLQVWVELGKPDLDKHIRNMEEMKKYAEEISLQNDACNEAWLNLLGYELPREKLSQEKFGEILSIIESKKGELYDHDVETLLFGMQDCFTNRMCKKLVKVLKSNMIK